MSVIDDLRHDVDQLKRRELRVRDLPVAALQRKLENDWRPTASIMFGTAAVITEMLADGLITTAKLAAGAVTNDKLDATTVLDKAGISSTAVTRSGVSNIVTAQSTAATTYAIGNLATPDRVQNITLPTDGLIMIGYQAIWQNTVANNARAAIFLGANQLKLATATGPPNLIEGAGPAELNDDAALSTMANSLAGTGGAGATTEVTTGQVIGSNVGNAIGGPMWAFAAAGTYDISVQFKNNAAGTTTVKNRHLWVRAFGF